MKPFKEFLNEAETTMSANVAGEPTGNPPTNSGFGANAADGGPVAGFDKYFFPNINDDLLSQDYQTPAEPGLAKWRFSNVWPVMKLELDKASDGPSIDQMVDASKEFVNIEAARTAQRMQRTYRQFQGFREQCEPQESFLTIPLNMVSFLSINSLYCLSLSASLTLIVITCLAVCAAILPKSKDGRSWRISSPIFFSLFFSSI